MRRAAEGRLDLSRLSAESRALIQRQVMAPTWRLDSQGRRVVVAKAETKRRIGRSPDDADALNLAFATVRRLETDRALWERPGRWSGEFASRGGAEESSPPHPEGARLETQRHGENAREQREIFHAEARKAGLARRTEPPLPAKTAALHCRSVPEPSSFRSSSGTPVRAAGVRYQPVVWPAGS